MTRKDEETLMRRMLSIGMGELMDLDEVPRDLDGNLLVCGMFAVPHKADYDRLIFNKPRQNLT